MCDLSNDVLEKGLHEGIEKGKIEGGKKATVQAIKNLMSNMHRSLEKAMETLGISGTESARYEKLLNEKAGNV